MRQFSSLGEIAVYAALIAVLVAGSAHADNCFIPGPAPTIPSGLSATAAEMHKSRDAIQEFVKALEDYQKCVEALVAAPPKDTPSEVVLAWKAQADAAIDDAHALADDFSAELKRYKARGLK